MGDQYGVGETVTEDFCTSQGAEWTNQNAKWSTSTYNFYWRIIRTNHDGSIRLLYVGTSPDTTTGNIGKSAFNTSIDGPKYVGYKYGEDTSLDTIRNNTTDSTIKTFIDSWYQNNLTNYTKYLSTSAVYCPKYVGYKYGEDTSLDTIRNNTTDSTIKTFIDSWYQTNLTNYTKYLSTSAVYCNDRSEGTGQTYNYASSPSSLFKFASFYRMDWDTKGAKANPSYNCTDIRDAFSVNNTSAKLTYPVSLMTADEIAFAGGVAFKTMNTPYAWFMSNSAGSKVSYNWWSLSPVEWDGYNRYVWYWDSDAAYLNESYVSTTRSVRPVISLKSCTLYSTGDGSATNPYTILETESGC
ncbi:unknown [Clostridium sp. CAG:628]|nr:unknown [Clostridium sp. CAG:628]